MSTSELCDIFSSLFPFLGPGGIKSLLGVPFDETIHSPDDLLKYGCR